MLVVFAILGLLAARPEAAAAKPHSQVPAVYEIPYRLSSTGHIVVRAKLNGKGPYSFILDTGAPTLIVSTDVAEAVGASHAPDNNVPFDRVEIEGGPVLRHEPGLVIDPFQLKTMNSIGLSDQKLAGVMGYTLVARFRLEIDLTQPHMRWTPLDYKPQPVMSLMALTGGKALRAAPSQAKLEGMADMASSLIGSAPPTTAVLRGFLGIALVDGSSPPAVHEVLPGSVASKAGFRPGDRVTYLQEDDRDPVATQTVAELLRAAARIPGGHRVSFTVERGPKNLLLVARAQRGGL